MKSEYKFSYGNKRNFIFSEIILFIMNFSSIFIVIIPICFLLGFFDNVFKNYLYVRKFLSIVLISIGVLYFIYVMIIFFLPKKAIVKKDFILVKRYWLSYENLSRGFNDKIDIKYITECKRYSGEKNWDLHPFASSYFFDWDCLIIIKTVIKNERNDRIKYYLVSLDNVNDFINEINSRIERRNFFEKLNIDNLLLTKDGKKLSYNDLNIRWKGKDKIDSVFYYDDNGDKVDIIKY